MKEQETLKSKVLEIITQKIESFLKDTGDFDPKSLRPLKIEYSRNEKFGDYSTAFLLENKDILGNPKDISEKFLPSLRDTDLFSEVSFSMPGFLNFRISRSALGIYLKTILEQDSITIPKLDAPEKIIFEFVSANPTGPLNIVSARAAATGDSICNLLSSIGHEVHSEFYVNDYGNQVLLMGVSCVLRLKEIKGETLSYQPEGGTESIEELLNSNLFPYEGYRGEYIKDIVHHYLNQPESKSIIESHLNDNSFVKLSELFSEWAVQFNLSKQKKDLENFGVHFKNFFSEKSLHDSGDVLKAESFLNSSGKIYSEDGKKIFRSTDYGDDKDRVVVREDGRPTYLLADIAYHKTKIDRNFTKIYNIWGPDHHGYIARLSGAIQALGYREDCFRILIAQQVNLISKGEKVKMSKRLGQFQTMEDLLEYLGEHGKDVARYFFITRALGTPLEFDLDLAKEESDKNPVFYLQYAHARIRSIFRENSEERDFDAFQNLESREERDRLLFWICRFPEEVLDSAIQMEPHRLTNYLQNLAKVFSKFYIGKENRIKDSDKETRLGLTYICYATALCLKMGLNLLGVHAPDILEKSN
ncbi:MAG: arginine--tRNA ligase [Leptospiraceae bacterium]|nr:arginine--tRNA ligase [Leptospiraceae bacterium]MCP5510713.1 arginine--tRNA ligase [Leptospiraceae bacterium]